MFSTIFLPVDWSVSTDIQFQSYLSDVSNKKNKNPSGLQQFQRMPWLRNSHEFITQITCSSRKTTTSKQVGTTNEKFPVFFAAKYLRLFFREISDFCKWAEKCQIQVVQNKLIAFQAIFRCVWAGNSCTLF